MILMWELEDKVQAPIALVKTEISSSIIEKWSLEIEENTSETETPNHDNNRIVFLLKITDLK